MAISAFSNLKITISDGGTVPSLDYLSTKTYVNIGSGNVLKVSWNTPTATNNAVDNYKIYILRYDSTAASYKSLYSANIGNVNEFYLKASVFASISQSFIPLHIYVEAISKYGSTYNGTSNTAAVNVSRGCGTYVRVSEGYAQPIMKRALAFARLSSQELLTKDSKTLSGIDEKTLYAKESSTQDMATGWTLMQEFYVGGGSNDQSDVMLVDAEDRILVDTNDAQQYSSAPSGWKLSDITYEVLTDINGEIITGPDDQSIYVL